MTPSIASSRARSRIAASSSRLVAGITGEISKRSGSSRGTKAPSIYRLFRSEVGIEGGALTIPALRVHEHAVDQQRVALPFVPEACASARYIRAVAALEHDALDRIVARPLADRR